MAGAQAWLAEIAQAALAESDAKRRDAGECRYHAPEDTACWDVITALPVDVHQALKGWAKALYEAHMNGSSDAHGCRCYKHEHLDSYGGYRGSAMVLVDSLDELLVFALGQGAPCEVIDALVRHGAELPEDDAYQLSVETLAEKAERPGPLDLVGVMHSLGRTDELSAAHLAHAITAYTFFGDTACIRRAERDAERGPFACAPRHRTCDCATCANLVRLLRALVRERFPEVVRIMQGSIVEAMQLVWRMDAAEKSLDAEVMQRLTDVLGDGIEGKQEADKIRTCMLYKAKVCLKGIQLLEQWHGQRELAKRALERAFAPVSGPRTSLIMSFLFATCSCTVCQGKSAAPMLLISLGEQLYLRRLLFPSEADLEPTSGLIGNGPVPMAESSHSAAIATKCTVSEGVISTEAQAQVDKDDGKDETLEVAEMTAALSQSEAAALQQEQQQLTEAILRSKACSGAAVSGDDVVIFRLTRCSIEIHNAFISSPQLADCRSQVEEAGCGIRPDFTSAVCLVPVTAEQYAELGLDLKFHHVLARRSDRGLIQSALRDVPAVQRPKLRDEKLGHIAPEWPEPALGQTLEKSNGTENRSGGDCDAENPTIVPWAAPFDELRVTEESVLHGFIHFRVLSEAASSHVCHSAPAAFC